MIWKIFFRDLKRLGSNITAVIVILGVCLIPALYAWFNIAANMDPYSNTRNIKIAVVNQDQGDELNVSALTGSKSKNTQRIALGSQLVSNLKKNVQLGWQFVDSRTALRGVRSGKYYAAIVIPADFSSSILSILNGRIHRPQIIYYSNEKKNAIAPKVTDTGASTIQLKINQTFSTVVSDTITDSLGNAAIRSRSSLSNAKQDVQGSLANASRTLGQFSSTIRSFQSERADTQKTIRETYRLLDQLDQTSADAVKTLNSTEKMLKSAQTASLSYMNTMNSSADAVAAAMTSLQSDTASASGKIIQSASTANAQISTQISQLNTIISTNQNTIDQMETLHSLLKTNTRLSSRITAQISTLQRQNAKLKEILSRLETANTDAEKVTSHAKPCRIPSSASHPTAERTCRS